MSFNTISKPTPYNTRIWLCKADIDISSGHQILFDTEDEKIKYFTSPERSIVLDDNRYISNKSGELKLDIELVDINGIYNYLIFINPEHENKYIICNIVDFVYKNDRISSVLYSVDNWQTYQHDIDFDRESYIVRRHFRSDEIHEIRNLPFEDLDRGRNNIVATETSHVLNKGESYFVITLSSPIYKTFTGNYTSLYNPANEMSYVDINNKTVSQKTDLRVIESTIVFIVNDVALLYLTQNVFNTPEHVNKLQKISYIPFDIDLLDIKKENQFVNATNKPDDKGKRKLYIPSPSTFARTYKYDVFNNAKNIIRKAIHGDYYMMFQKDFEKISSINMTAQELYFMRAPFTSLQIHDVTGNISEYDYKEVTSYWNDDITLRVFGTLGIIPTIAYNVFPQDKYQHVNPLLELQNKSLDFQLTVPSDLSTKYILPSETISIVNDYTSAYLQANQNQISQQRSNIDTNFDMSVNNINAQAQRNLSSANLSFNNSNIGRETDMINFNINQTTQKTNNNLGMLGQGFNMAMGGVGNLASGNIGGAISSVIGGATNMAVGNQQFNNSLQSNASMFNNSMASSLQIDKNNLAHQQSMINDMKAQNLRNTAIQSKMSIDTLNARMLDVKNHPDTISSMTGGTLMNVLFNRYNINMVTYVAHPRTINRLSNYISEYGMLSNNRENLKTVFDKAKYGTYIQTVNANINGKVPQTALNDIKTMLDNGMFLWKDPKNYRKNEIMKDI